MFRKKLYALVTILCLAVQVIMAGGTETQAASTKSYYPKNGKLTKSYIGNSGASDWNRELLTVIRKANTGGKYSVRSDAFSALLKSAYYKNGSAHISLNRLAPSFCSGAVYTAILQTLSENYSDSISEAAWTNLCPKKGQGDGVGCWGYANANGPGVAMLVKKLKAGKNIYISCKNWSKWEKAKPGDLLKIFRTSKIGKSENGHMVVYLGRKVSKVKGKRDDIIYYWSSQSTTRGKGITSCRASKIRRGVLTQITDPSAFDNARTFKTTSKNTWLASLLKKNVTLKDMKKHLGIK